MSNIISKYKETGMISIDQPVGYNTMKSRLYNWKKRGLLSPGENICRLTYRTSIR